VIRAILVFAIRTYRVAISPLLTLISAPLGFGCRFTPTCSQYALEALKTHGALRGSLLSARRICRCHPWGGSGYDPVPCEMSRKAG
jgi:putative membrane protein insertion efficiency factor